MPGGGPTGADPPDDEGGQPTLPLTGFRPEAVMTSWAAVVAADSVLPPDGLGTGGGSVVDGSPSDESMLALKSNSWYEDDQLRYQRRMETIDGRDV